MTGDSTLGEGAGAYGILGNVLLFATFIFQWTFDPGIIRGPL